MNIKERAAYAWGRIKNLFTKKKPEIEVEIEEEQPVPPEEAPAEAPAPVQEAAPEVSEPVEEPVPEEPAPAEEPAPEFSDENAEVDLSPDDIEVEIYEEAEEAGTGLKADEDLPAEEELPSRDALTLTDEPAPSRMTDEYIAWMKAQREAADAENNRAPFETEQ